MIAPAVPLPKVTPSKSCFAIELATQGDDEELRALLRRSPVPGPISVSFEREPSFFDSCRVRGDFFKLESDVIVARTKSLAWGPARLHRHF